MRSLLVVALSTVALAAQQTPARDAASTQTGTATISGTVVADGADARPLRLATVSLSGAPLRGQLIASSDDNGQFVFRNLPAGRFSISAQRPGYVETDYGAARPGGLGIPVVVKAGEQTAVTVKLAKGAAIGGTIMGPDGQPASGVAVRLMQYQPSPTEGRVLSGPRSVTGWHWQRVTDDQGSYRFYGVPPGEYYVGALPVTATTGARMPTASEFDWARAVLQAPGTAPTAPPPGPTMSLGSVMYPGTADPSAALPIIIAGSEDRLGVDFALQYVPTATISGVVIDPDGLPPRGVQVTMVMPSMSPFIRFPVVVRPGADGRFSASGVLPGQYQLAMRGFSGQPLGAGSAPASGPAAPPLWALVDVTVDGRDISNLQVRLLPGVNVSGRLVFDGSTAKPPDDFRSIRISLSPMGDTVTIGAADVQATANGTFTLTGVAPGKYRLNATLPPAQGAVWTLRSSTVGGADSQDYPFEVRPGIDLTDASITFTDKPTEITGTLFDAAGQPTPQYFILVFSTDRTMWRAYARRVKYARPGNTGEFRVVVPAGEYYLCAVTDLDPYQMYSNAFLDPLAAVAQKITLAEGEKRAQDLHLAKLPSPQRY